MCKIEIARSGYTTPSVVYFESTLDRLYTLSDPSGSVVITNPSLASLYAEALSGFRVICVPEGEAHKCLSSVEQIHRELLAMGCDRSLQLVGFGGGIITDITGFVASTYMRGVRFGFVATSLLAQVDASVGGKNGVNLDGYKNMIGCFNQPDWVICSTSVLETLPPRELIAGYAEVIKSGIIRSESLFEMFERGEIDLSRSVRESVEIKARVVENDEKESGERKLLNLGHTFAHAIEKCSKGRYLHGEAVGVGMVMASQMALKLSLTDELTLQRIKRAVENCGLPTSVDELSKDDLIKAMTSDKKRSADSLDFVLPTTIGNAVIRKIEIKDIANIL
ncbi:MAG: 3-dehydroquinate synthase [Rikenellaceae bacterium]